MKSKNILAGKVKSINREYISGIDLTKFIGAILVLMSHTGLFYTYNDKFEVYFINIVFRWVVPFFFLASGFFMHKDANKFANYIFRISLLYFSWTIIYIILFDLSFSRRTILNGIIVSFWFFPSLLLSVLLVWLLNKAFSPLCVVVISGMLYVLALIGDSWNNIPAFSNIVNSIYSFHHILYDHTTRDGVLFGSLYISIGHYLRTIHKKGKLVLENKIKCILLLVICYVFSIVEIVIQIFLKLGSDKNVLIGTIPVSILILVLSLNMKIEKELSMWFRKMSTLIYVTHLAFMKILDSVIHNSIQFFLTVFFSQ